MLHAHFNGSAKNSEKKLEFRAGTRGGQESQFVTEELVRMMKSALR